MTKSIDQVRLGPPGGAAVDVLLPALYDAFCVLRPACSDDKGGNHRTATICQIRGLLLDRGISIGAAMSRVRRAVPLILEDAENGLSIRMRKTIAELYELFIDLEKRINFFDKEIETVFRQSAECQRIAKVKGNGPKTATAVVAAIGIKNGRHFAT